MKNILTLVMAIVGIQTPSIAKNCSWCVRQNPQVLSKVRSWSKLSPKRILARVRNESICVRILDSGRKVPQGLFTWGQVEKPTGKLSIITQQKSLMGKTLCADEHPLASHCMTIVIASDAPKSTLIHEYLHTRQILSDPAWCPISKASWNAEPDKEGRQAFMDHEWDVHQFLWEQKDKLGFSLEDKLGIASNLLEQSKARAATDPAAEKYIADQKVLPFIENAIIEYKKALGIKN